MQNTLAKLLSIAALAFCIQGPALAVQNDDRPAEDEPSMFEQAVSRARDVSSNLIIHAMGLIGVNYKYGGSTPEGGLDCSGFVAHVFREAAGITLPHNAYRISQIGKQIASNELKPGDLVFYNTLKRTFSHVGIYLGEGKFIHAPATGKQIQIADMNNTYWRARFEGARRIEALEETAQPQVQ